MAERLSRRGKSRAFLEGFLSVFDVFGAMRPDLRRPAPANGDWLQRDLEAIRKDWEAVGQDMHAAIREVERQLSR